MDALFAFGQLLAPVIFFVVFGLIGRVIEHRHEASLDEREAAMAHVLVVASRTVPGPATSGELVIGSVALGCDYGKQIFARVRNVFGGEVNSFRRVLERAHREAVLRMQAEAEALGSNLVVNVRFTTAMMGSRLLAAEVTCYGTAVGR